VNENLTKTQFKALIDAYLGARDHERWAATKGTAEEYRLALEASRKAREALEKGVFGP